MATAKEKVLQKFPGAYVYNWESEWSVYASKTGPLTAINLGSGRRARDAWTNAAARLVNTARLSPTPPDTTKATP